MASKTKKTKEPASTAALPIVTDPEMAERFERELAWCIGQLECMMKSSSMKDKDPPRSALQVLTNPKSSLIRKRQMMQQLFGDYRKKMHDEDIARQKRHNQIRASANSEIPLASRFVRRIQSNNDSTIAKENTFSFNFDIPLYMSIEQNLLINIVDQIVILDENFSSNDLNAVRTFKSTALSPNSSINSLLQILPISIQRQVNEYLNEIIGQLVLCTGVNVKSQLPNTISHIIKRTIANRKEIQTKNNHFLKQINSMNDLYTKLNTQIQNICIEQLKMIKANDLNTNQIDTLREQYQLLLKQIQLRRCEFIRDTYPMENIELLQKMKLDYEEKQHQYDEQINYFKKLEIAIENEGVHYQQLIKRYYELCDELINTQNALKRLKQQKDNISI